MALHAAGRPVGRQRWRTRWGNFFPGAIKYLAPAGHLVLRDPTAERSLPPYQPTEADKEASDWMEIAPPKKPT
jgi:hypothetical protein